SCCGFGFGFVRSGVADGSDEVRFDSSLFDSFFFFESPFFFESFFFFDLVAVLSDSIGTMTRRWRKLPVCIGITTCSPDGLRLIHEQPLPSMAKKVMTKAAHNR